MMTRLRDQIDTLSDLAGRIASVILRLCRVGDRLIRLLFVLLPLYLIYRGEWLSLGAFAFVILVFYGMTAGPRRGSGASPIEGDDRDHPYRRRPIHQSWRH